MSTHEKYQKHEDLINPEWRISATTSEQTGVRIYTVEHPSDFIPTVIHLAEPNPNIDITSTQGWVAAKTSRSQQSFEDAFREAHKAMEINPKDAAEHLAKVFVNYGHASVGDMVPIFLYFNKIPIHLAYEIFYYISVGAGQESSTRYIEFNDLEIDSPDLLLPLDQMDITKAQEVRERWQMLQNRCKENYMKWNDKIKLRYAENFPKSNPKSLDSRTKDIARLWIPSGSKTSLSLLMSTRDWVRMIKILRESPDIRNRVLAEQVMAILRLSETEEGKDIAVNVGSLLGHNEPTYTIPTNLESLKEYLENYTDIFRILPDPNSQIHNDVDITEETSVSSMEINLELGLTLQSILELYPQLKETQLLSWLKKLPPESKETIMTILLNNHSDHDQLRNAGDIRSSTVFSLKTAIAYLRDLNRHKAFGRFTDLFGLHNPLTILNDGFIRPAQIFNMGGMKEFKDEWMDDANMYYRELYDLTKIIQEYFPDNDGRWLLRLLPLGHMSRMHMSAPITQLLYMISLREKRGGDIGYIDIAQRMLSILRKKVGLGKMLSKSTPLDLNSLKEFNERS